MGTQLSCESERISAAQHFEYTCVSNCGGGKAKSFFWQTTEKQECTKGVGEPKRIESLDKCKKLCEDDPSCYHVNYAYPVGITSPPNYERHKRKQCRGYDMSPAGEDDQVTLDECKKECAADKKCTHFSFATTTYENGCTSDLQKCKCTLIKPKDTGNFCNRQLNSQDSDVYEKIITKQCDKEGKKCDCSLVTSKECYPKHSDLFHLHSKETGDRKVWPVTRKMGTYGGLNQGLQTLYQCKSLCTNDKRCKRIVFGFGSRCTAKWGPYRYYSRYSGNSGGRRTMSYTKCDCKLGIDFISKQLPSSELDIYTYPNCRGENANPPITPSEELGEALNSPKPVESEWFGQHN